MKYLTTLLLIYLMFLTSCATGPVKVKKPFLWVAKKNDKVIRLFGTIHLKGDVIEIPKAAIDELKKSEVVYVEMTKSNAELLLTDKVDNFFKKFYSVALKPYPNLYKKLSKKAQYNVKFMMTDPATQRWLKEKEISVDLDVLSPALVYFTFINFAIKRKYKNNQVLSKEMLKYIIYTMKISENVRSKDKSIIMDRQIEKIAGMNMLPVMSLDESEILYRVLEYLPRLHLNFESDPQKYGVILIEQLFGDYDEVIKHYEEAGNLLDVYVDSNIPELLELFNKMPSQFKNIALKERNESWLEPLLEQNQVQNLFVAVGLAHLLGDDNLLDMLTSRGYVVTRLGNE